MEASDLLPFPQYLVTFSRLVVGVVFATSFVGKMRDLAAFERAIASFRIVPTPLVKVTTYLLLCAELAVLGLMLLGGRFLGIGFLSAILLLLVFSAALLSVLVRGLQIACHCFGPTNQLVTGYDVLRNAGFIVCAVVGRWLLPLAEAQPGLDVVSHSLLAFLALVFVIGQSKVGEIIETMRGL